MGAKGCDLSEPMRPKAEASGNLFGAGELGAGGLSRGCFEGRGGWMSRAFSPWRLLRDVTQGVALGWYQSRRWRWFVG